jgi:hypothetical protein
MKKLFSLLTLALLTMSAWAETTVTFTPGDPAGTTTADKTADEMASDGITVTCDNAAFGRTDNYRFYAGSTATITSTVGNITKIEITCTATGTNNYGPGNSTYTVGTYTTDGSKGTWTGEATTVQFTTTKQIRCTKIVFTIDDGGSEHIDAPVFDPENNTKFIGSQTITLTCADENASILYRINDGDYQAYTAAFPIYATSTIYAKAVKGEAESNEVHANYYRMEEVSTVAQANALDSATYFIFYGNPVVTYRNGGRIWIQDETGYGLIFGNQVSDAVVEGATLAEEWDAQFTLFHGMSEFQFPNNVGVTEDALVEMTATEYTEAEIDASKMHQRILLKGVSLVAGEDAKYLYTADGLAIYNQFNITYPTDLEGNTYDIEAMVGYYNGLQLLPINITLAGGQPIITCAAPTLPASTTFTDNYEVVITNNEEGATVYYALNDGDFQEYTAPFTVEETTTVKAYATISGVNSEEVTATYTKVEPAVERTFALVTDAAELADGDMIILVSAGVAGDAYAMGAAKPNNFGTVNVTIAEDLTITTDAANVITLEAQDENWAMKANEGYLYAAGANLATPKNYLKAQAEIDSLSIAAITIDPDSAAATIVFVGATQRNYLRFNINMQSDVPSPLFNCYNEDSSIQTPAYIFKVKGDEPVINIGDVNNDDVVNITDVTMLINAVLNDNYSTINTANADMNGDGIINVTDVTLLITKVQNS